MANLDETRRRFITHFSAIGLGSTLVPGVLWARMQDANALRQRAKVNLVRDEELAKLLPVRVAIVEIELTDGTRLSERVEAVRGTPRNPMSRAEIIEKARNLVAPILGRAKSERLIETVYGIETVTDIRRLRPLLQRG